jgi:hypothetical protein
LLELPVALLVLATAPALQRMTAAALLTLQLLRLLLGPASLTNLVAAVLSFLLLDDETWVPVLLRLAKKLKVPVLRPGGDQQEGQEQGQAGETEPLSRQSSITSLFGGCQHPQGMHKVVWKSLCFVGVGIGCACAVRLAQCGADQQVMSVAGHAYRPVCARLHACC